MIHTDYKSYDKERVLIKSTGEQGQAYESMYGVISVFIEGEDVCRYFNLKDVKFLP